MRWAAHDTRRVAGARRGLPLQGGGVMGMGWVSLWVGVVVTYDVFIVVFAIIIVTVI